MTAGTISRLLAGYILGIGIFIVGIPWLAILCARLLDRLIGLPQPFTSGVGLAVFIPLSLFGLFWAVWSNLYLLIIGRGGPTESFGVGISPPTRRLVTSGPYRHTRNPMVLGALTIYLSTGFLFPSISLFVIIFPVLCILSYLLITRGEEKRLGRELGEEYLRYREWVPMYLPQPWRVRRP